jgi:hypothetical protein
MKAVAVNGGFMLGHGDSNPEEPFNKIKKRTFWGIERTQLFI